MGKCCTKHLYNILALFINCFMQGNKRLIIIMQDSICLSLLEIKVRDFF